MLLAALIALAVIISMARRGRGRRKFRRYIKGQIDFTLSLGTLATLTVIGATVGDSVIEKAYCTSVKCSYSLSGFTAAAGDGPILVGVSHGDYTDAEVEEWIETTDSWEETDMIGQEIARRKIRKIGTIRIPPGSAITDAFVLNEGKPMTTKCGYVLSTGQTVRFWAYNLGTSSLTSGALLKVQGHANLWPM